MEKGSEELMLLKAAHEGRLDDVKRVLEDVKRDHVDVDCVDDRRCTPLFLAAEAGHEDVAQYLIDQGAYVNVRDNEEKTPLLLAAQNGHDKIVQLLIEYGAALNPADIHKKTPLMLAAQNGHDHVVELLVNAGVFSKANKQDKSGVKVEDTPEWFVAPNEVQFDPNSSLARGSYGRVCPGIWNGVKVAVKSLLMGNENDHEVFLNEAEIWAKLKHPHIVTMFGACHVGNPFFVCELASNGTLLDYLPHDETRSKTWAMLHQAALGLQYLHTQHKVVHGDLKCSNILVGSDGNAKLCDFGSSSKLDNIEKDKLSTGEVGAIYWKAPEVISGETRGTFASDVYSFGMCIVEAVTGQPPWATLPNVAVKYKVLKQRALPNRAAEMSDNQWDLVKRMCAWEPADRIKISQAVDILEDLANEESQARWSEFEASREMATTESKPGSNPKPTVKPSVPDYDDPQAKSIFDVAHNGEDITTFADDVKRREKHIFADDEKWKEEAKQAINAHKLVLKMDKDVNVLSELCNSIRENKLLCLQIHDRIKALHESLKRIDSSDGRFDDTEVVSETWRLVDAFHKFLEKLVVRQNNAVEQLIMQRRVLNQTERFHAEIDVLCDRLTIDKTPSWKKEWELHQADMASRFRARVTKDDQLLSGLGNWRNTLKRLEDEMILCEDFEHLPAMQFVCDAIDLGFSSGYAVDICLLNAGDLVVVDQQKKMNDSFVVFQVGTETQYSKLFDSHLSSTQRRFRFSLERKNVTELSVEVWAYGPKSVKEERNIEAWSTPQLIGTVSIPLPPLLFQQPLSSDGCAYTLKAPEVLGNQKRQSTIHLKLHYSDVDSMDKLFPLESERGCIICGSPTLPGRLYCASCAGIFGQPMLTETLPIWFIPRKKITVDTSFQGIVHESVTVFGGALEHDSSVDVWCLSPSKSPSKKHEREMLIHQIDLWFMLNHPHILRLFGACHIEQPIICVCEHGSYANIVDFLSKNDNMNYVWIVLYQVALGLHYLHSQRIVHGDVRSENIVLGIDGNTKLCNFGFTYRRRGTSLFRASAQKKTIRCLAPERINGNDMLEPMFESDVYEFGMTIIEIVTRENPWRALTDDDIYESVSEKHESFALPDSLDPTLLSLVANMCAFDFKKRPDITTVVAELGKLAFPQGEGIIVSGVSIYSMEDAFRLFKDRSHNHMKRYEHKARAPIVPDEVFIPERLRNLCMNMDATEMKPMCQSLLLRLEEMQPTWTDVSLQTRKLAVSCYTSISNDLCVFITKYGAAQPILRLLCGPKFAEMCQRFHYQLDHLLRVCGFEVTSGWKTTWEAINQARLKTTESMMTKPKFVQSELQDPEIQNQAWTLLLDKSACTKYGEIEQTLVAHTLEHINKLSVSQSETIPQWFVPRYQIEFCSDAFANGDYGSVCHGKWNGADVVIKAPLHHDEHSRKMFMKEADIWFDLRNPHVVSLFGACHIGSPFFVCEIATNGTISDYAAKVESSLEIWKKLREVALGLQYIQTKNVVHYDIKGNNILVGADGKSKIADFGLSFRANSEEFVITTALNDIPSLPTNVDVGAIPWKAPEIVGGVSPGSSASDVYALGMCMIEVVSGNIPWGLMPDSTIKIKVAKQKELPKRPAKMTDAQWELIQQMCAWQPKDRLSIDQVVGKLQDIVYEEGELEFKAHQEMKRKAEEEQRRQAQEEDTTATVAASIGYPAEWDLASMGMNRDQLLRLKAQLDTLVFSTSSDLEAPDIELDQDACSTACQK